MIAVLNFLLSLYQLPINEKSIMERDIVEIARSNNKDSITCIARAVIVKSLIDSYTFVQIAKFLYISSNRAAHAYQCYSDYEVKYRSQVRYFEKHINIDDLITRINDFIIGL